MRIIAVLALLGAFLLTVRGGDLDPNVNTTNVPEELELCAEGVEDGANLNCTGLNRYCITNTTDDASFCGPCLNGTIEDFTAPPEVEFPYCIFVSDITEENFRKAFGRAIELNQTDIAERLVIIWIVAEFVSAHNSQWPPPDFKLSLNALAALTKEEHDARNGAQDAAVSEEGLDFIFDLQPERYLEEIPDKVDWSQTKAVTSVKNQGQCGCCWAVSIAGALEGAAAINSNFTWLEDVSFQQLVSCDTQQLGCGGGNVITALQYTTDNPIGGVTNLQTLPFSDFDGETTDTCPDDLLGDAPLSVVVPSLALAVSSTDPADPDQRVLQMKQALAKQPLVVLMDGTCLTIQTYKSGIIDDDGDCGCIDGSCIDHAVLMVGYDDTSDPPSFKIKNSWSTDWGEDGYFRIAQTVSTLRPYGLFNLLYQGSAGVDVFNSTVASEYSSAATAAWALTALASAAMALFSLF